MTVKLGRLTVRLAADLKLDDVICQSSFMITALNLLSRVAIDLQDLHEVVTPRLAACIARQSPAYLLRGDAGLHSGLFHVYGVVR